MSALKLIEEGIVSNNMRSIIEGYKQLTGKDLSDHTPVSEERSNVAELILDGLQDLLDHYRNPSNELIEKIDSVETEDSDDDFDEEEYFDIEVPVIKQNTPKLNGPVKASTPVMPFANAVDKQEQKKNAALVKKAKQQGVFNDRRQKSDNNIECISCNHVFNGNRHFHSIGQGGEGVKKVTYKCPNCQMKF